MFVGMLLEGQALCSSLFLMPVDTHPLVSMCSVESLPRLLKEWVRPSALPPILYFVFMSISISCLLLVFIHLLSGGLYVICNIIYMALTLPFCSCPAWVSGLKSSLAMLCSHHRRPPTDPFHLPPLQPHPRDTAVLSFPSPLQLPFRFLFLWIMSSLGPSHKRSHTIFYLLLLMSSQ